MTAVADTAAEVTVAAITVSLPGTAVATSVGTTGMALGGSITGIMDSTGIIPDIMHITDLEGISAWVVSSRLITILLLR